MNKFLVFSLLTFLVNGCTTTKLSSEIEEESLLATGWSTTRETPEIVKVATYGDLESLELLISKGVDVNVDMGRPLREASRRGNIEIITSLINAGANVNPPTLSGSYETPLIAATEKGNIEVVKFLIQSGANLNVTVNIIKFSPPQYRLPIASDYKVISEHTALMIASKYNDLEIVNVLLEAGADVNQRTEKRGDTALSLAVDYGHIEIVETLIAKGADIIQRYRNTQLSIVEQSIKMGRTEITKILIDSGAEVKK